MSDFIEVLSSDGDDPYDDDENAIMLHNAIKDTEESIKLAYNQGYSDCKGFKTKDYKKSVAYKELQEKKESK